MDRTPMKQREAIQNVDRINKLLLGKGASLESDGIEAYCQRRGLCPLCAKTRTRKRVFKLLKRNQWELLTVLDKNGDYKVYKGYCVKPTCFTLDQAKRLSGEPMDPRRNSHRPRLPRKNSRSNKPPLSGDDDQESDNDSNSSGDGDGVGNPAAHKRSKEAFPPPELRSATNFEVKDKEALFVVRKAVEGLEQNSKYIATLDLSEFELRTIDFEALAEGLKVSTTLSSLILENSRLDDENTRIIASGLCQAKDIPLVKLDMRNNQVGDPGVGALGPFLQANNTLEKLDLSQNYVTCNGATALFSAFLRNRFTRIRSINLAHNNLGDLGDAASGIGPFLLENQSLRVLNLEGNNLNDKSVHALAEGIKNNNCTALERLYLGRNAICDEGTMDLAEMLEVNTSLRVLGLGGNQIQNAGARSLLAAMDENTTIQEISGLWKNRIDRRFIVVAIRKLLLSTDRVGGPAHVRLDEQAPSNSVNSVGQINSVDIDFEIESRPDSGTFDEGTETVVSAMTADDFVDEKDHSICPGKNPSIVVGSEETRSTRPEESLGSSRATTYASPPVHSPTCDRLVVFQSTPLVTLDRDSGANQRIPLFDTDHESLVIQEALGQQLGADAIHLEVEVATLDRFTAFFKQSLAHVLHFSCSGHTDQLMLENGFGSKHAISHDELKLLVSSVVGGLQVVFVSCRNAKSIGQIFVKAGVPHVVCCELDDRFRDLVGMDFVQNFYRSLAQKKTLKHAFQIARSAVSSGPQAQFIRRLLERFELLPERADYDPYHSIPVFFTQGVPHDLEKVEQDTSQLRIPPIPQHYLGREVVMYDILGAIRVNDIVRISGPPGVGKHSVMSAVCHYLWKRRHSFEVDNIFWLPAPNGFEPDEDSLYGDLCLCTDILMKAQSRISWDDDDNLLECRERIEIEMEEMQVVVVFDCRQFQNTATQEGLVKFFSFLLNAAQAKIILIESRTSTDAMSVSQISRETTGSPFKEAAVEVHPLDFKATAQLFGETSKFITSSSCPAAHNATEFAELLEPIILQSQEASFTTITSQRRSALYALMGHGMPKAVIAAANAMDPKGFIQLVGIASRPEVVVDSLGALDVEIRRRGQQQSQAVDDKNYLRASHIDDLLQELEAMRSEFPSLEDMKQEEELMKADLAEAVSNRRYDLANDMKRDFLALKKKIIKEQRCLNSIKSKNGKYSSAAKKMNALEAQVQILVKSSRGEETDLEIPFCHTIGCNSGEVSFAVNCGDHGDCSFVVSIGNVWDFDHPAEAHGIVCWTNESCHLAGTFMGDPLLRMGGSELVNEISELPTVSKTSYGLVRCAMGNAILIGPGEFGSLNSPCIILTVGPLSPNTVAADAKAVKDVDQEDDLVTGPDFLIEAKTILRSCYRSSIVLAKHSELHALALCLMTMPETSPSYLEIMSIGLKTLAAEVQFSYLRDLHLVARTANEATVIANMLEDMGYSQI